MALELTAVQAALIPFELALTVTKRAESKSRGRTTWAETSKTFDGALVMPSQFSGMIAPGGIDDTADRLLVVGEDLVDSVGKEPLTIDKDDWIQDGSGGNFRVVDIADTSGLLGLIVYELRIEKATPTP